MSKAKDLINKRLNVVPKQDSTALSIDELKHVYKLEIDVLRKRASISALSNKVAIQELVKKYVCGELDGAAFLSDFQTMSASQRIELLVSLLPYIVQRYDAESPEASGGSSSSASLNINGTIITI